MVVVEDRIPKDRLYRVAKTIVVLIVITGLLLLAGGEASAADLLRYGSRGAGVTQLQQDLKGLGYFTYHQATGYFGGITQDAVKAYQRSKGLTADGIVGPKTRAALNTNHTTLQFGMRGSSVVKLQDALRSQGVFHASSTGYYGKLTENAVIGYQIANRLRIDGIAGPETQGSLFGNQSTQPAPTPSRGDTSQEARDDIYWLARIIYAEARGESYQGQVAVGSVVLNRVSAPQFPSSIYGVIFEYTGSIPQFSPVQDGSIHNTPSNSAMRAAQEAYGGTRIVGNATYFFNPSKAAGSWIVNNKTYVTAIGNHVFYR
ncbi:MAG TPA: peptidoglycan-binding protein [Bacillota bacterium]|nr:peptidoglycan-binding protein [Bacillota bacterium]